MRERLGNAFARITARASAIQRNDPLGAFAGLVVLALLVVADLALGDEVNLVGTLIVVPFVAALWAGTAVTGLVALVVLAVGAASGSWNMNFGAADYDARIIVLVIGGLLAVASAWARERARHGARRLELLDDVGAIADGSLPLKQTLERVMEVIVPAFADFCMVDAIHSHRVMRSAVRVGGRAADGEDRRMERRLAGREPSLPEWMIRPQAPFPRQPRFIPRFNDEDIKRLAHGPDDLEWLRGLDLRSSITVAMLARDRMLGALTLTTAWSGRRYSLHDVRFAQALAGRVALALDNAGLFSDLESVERRMDNVMSILDEAVVIHDSDGELVFANPAAARMMGFDGEPDGAPGPTAPPTAAIRDRFVIRAEDGSLVPPEELVGRRALRGEPTEPLVLRVSPREGGPERWLITRAKPIMGPDGKALYSVTAIEDVTAVKRAEYAQRLLARTGELLATSSDPEAMMRGLADLMTPEFCDSCTYLEPRVKPPSPEDDPAVIVAPISAGGQSFGALVFANRPEGREFDDEDWALAFELARRAAAALETGRLAAERAEVAHVLQEGLKPPALPHMPGWESAAIYLPAGEVNAVGGDFYDAFEVEDGWMVTVGDVVGRGAAAASLTALARHTIRTAGLLTGDPRRALELLDAELRDRGETALCTAAIMVLPRLPDDPAEVTFVSAGHPLPLLLRDGRVEEVGTPGPLLGAFEGASWQPEVLRLEPGDQLVLFTDGVVEARGREDRFGEGRLRAELAGAEGPLAAVRRITRALDGFLGAEPDDDVAVVAVRRQVLQRVDLDATPRGPAAAARDAVPPA